jgi:hypothetical protein
MLQPLVEPPGALDFAAKALARLVCVVLGCAIAVTMVENLHMIRSLSQI